MIFKKYFKLTLLSILLLLKFSNLAYTQSQFEYEYETESEYLYENEYDDYYLEVEEDLSHCEDLLIYGNNKYKNFLHTSFKGKDRYIFFKDAIVFTHEGAISGVLLPYIIKQSQGSNSFFEAYIEVDRFWSDDKNFAIKLQYNQVGNPTNDCIDFMPKDMLTAFMTNKSMSLDDYKKNNNTNKFESVSLSFSFVNNDNPDEFVKGELTTSNIIEVFNNGKITYPEANDNRIQSSQVFYNEHDNALYVKRYSSPLTSLMSKIDIIKEPSKGFSFTEVKNFNKESVTINYYDAEVIRSTANHNRIFDFSENNEIEYTNVTLTKTITVENLISLAYLEPVVIPNYFAHNQTISKVQELTLEDLQNIKKFKVNALISLSLDYCPLFLDNLCIIENLNVSKNSAVLTVNIENRVIKSDADEFLIDFYLFSQGLFPKYGRDLEMEDFGDSRDAIIKDISDFLDKHSIAYKKPLTVENVINLFTSFETNKELHNRFGKENLERASNNLSTNLRDLQLKKVMKSEVGQFVSDFFELSAQLDQPGDASDDAKFIKAYQDLLDKYSIPFDSEVEIKNLEDFEILEIVVKNHFGEEKYYNAMETIMDFSFESMYEAYFPASFMPEQILTLDPFTGLTKKRKFENSETVFEIIYHKNRITLKAENKVQGMDEVSIEVPEGIIDIFSLPVILAHSNIKPEFNQEFAMFDLSFRTAFTYSTGLQSVDMDFENSDQENIDIQTERNITIHAKPLFLTANVKYIDIQKDPITNTSYYRLKVNINGKYSDSYITNYIKHFEEESSSEGFYMLIEKEFPHRLVNIR